MPDRRDGALESTGLWAGSSRGRVVGDTFTVSTDNAQPLTCRSAGGGIRLLFFGRGGSMRTIGPFQWPSCSRSRAPSWLCDAACHDEIIVSPPVHTAVEDLSTASAWPR